MQGFWSRTMPGKSKKRRRAKKYLYRNFKAGSLETDEHYLGRAGLRGRKIFFCYSLLVGMLVFSLLHLTVTCAILGVLRFEAEGFPFLQTGPSSTVWTRGGNLTNVTITTPHGVSSFLNQSLGISCREQEKVKFESRSQSRLSSLSLANSLAELLISDSFSVKHPQQTPHPPPLYLNSTLMQVPELSVAGTLTSTATTTHTLQGVRRVESPEMLILRGPGGVDIRGGSVNFTSNGPLQLNAQAQLQISSNRGIVILDGTTPTVTIHYHVCARANGTLFLVPRNLLRCRGNTST